MPRPARPWFRFYVEAFTDDKLLRLTPAQRWLWVAVLGAARKSCEPGRLVIAEGEAMTVAELARFADVPVEDVWPALEQMRRYGMVTWDDNGLIEVCRWAERQFESDNTTARTAKHRSKERSYEQPNDVPGNGPDTETETDTHTRDFASWYADYPRKVGRQAAEKAYRARRRSGMTADELVRARENYALSVATVDAQFIKHASTFLGPDVVEWVDAPPVPGRPTSVKPSTYGTPTRALLGRGVDAKPVFEINDEGLAVPVREAG